MKAAFRSPLTIMQLSAKSFSTTQWLLVAITSGLGQLLQPMVFAESVLESESSSEETPSKELLEFLVNYGDIDDESFELIVFHGQRDVNENKVQQPSIVEERVEKSDMPLSEKQELVEGLSDEY